MDIELKTFNEELIDKSTPVSETKKKERKSSFKASEIYRTANFNGYTTNTNPEITNKLNNRKHTTINLIPAVLYEQFKYFFNLFFLLLAVSQFIPLFQVGLLFSYVAPLVFVLVLTILKEAYDDYKRYVRDKETNETLYKVWKGTSFVETKAQDLREGNIIELTANMRIPADCLLLWTSDPSQSVFIKTDQLDGETDWKLRNPIVYSQKALNKVMDVSRLSGHAKFEQPSNQIYEFKGVFVNEQNREADEPLGLINTLWASTVLCSSHAIAMVIYVGQETRIAMNISEQRVKIGTLDSELNMLSKLLFLVMLIISIVMKLMASDPQNFIVGVIKYVLLLSSIIPISLRVNLDFSKIIFTYKINSDKEIEAIVRNSQIPEELGRIGIILSDKTGTITQNEMQFKQISSEYLKFGNDEKKIHRVLQKELKENLDSNSLNNKSILDKSNLSKGRVARELILALGLCHNVTPVEEDGVRILQASSPDEIALMNAAEVYGLILVSRTQKNINLRWKFTNEDISYQVLKIFPFTSERKRMGIIVKDKNRIVFYVKGADFIMKNLVPEVKTGFLMDECDDLSREGLRTLVYTYKILTQEVYDAWEKKYAEASASLNRREELQWKAVDELEKGLQFLAVTGVEDKLQEDCANTIESLKSAGVNIWMLTGDKIETVSCVAISTGLKGLDQEFFVLKEIISEEVLTKELNNFASRGDKGVLVVDGNTLITIFTHNEEFFFRLASEAESVIACRCSPTQKAQIVKCLKKYSDKITLSIGDGGNDVPMIQSADVGVGIVGKEGRQAALASDFSITKFKHLTDLLLWHGRNSYKRGAIMSQFVIHRGLIISIMQVYFTILFGYLQIPLFNGYLMLGYTTVYTMLPVFALIFDEDVDRKTALTFPILYKNLQKGRELTTKTFYAWLWKSIYQAFIIVMMNIAFFEQPFIDFVATNFTALIFVQLMNTITETHNYNLIMFVSIIFSLGTYILSYIFLDEYFSTSSLDFMFFLKAFIIALVCHMPFVILQRLSRRFAPTEEQKIMKSVGMKEKGRIRKFIDRFIFCEKNEEITEKDLF